VTSSGSGRARRDSVVFGDAAEELTRIDDRLEAGRYRTALLLCIRIQEAVEQRLNDDDFDVATSDSLLLLHAVVAFRISFIATAMGRFPEAETIRETGLSSLSRLSPDADAEVGEITRALATLTVEQRTARRGQFITRMAYCQHGCPISPCGQDHHHC
jgi:hypothetical protein